MGTTHSAQLAEEARASASRFDACELRLIKETFKDLAHLRGGAKSKNIDKETFLQYFPLPGLLGERLFAVFDRKQLGEIDYEEFVIGLSITCRGSWAEKVEFIFHLYDVHGAGEVNREQLTALVNHVPRAVTRLNMRHHAANGAGRRYVPFNRAKSLNNLRALPLPRDGVVGGGGTGSIRANGGGLCHHNSNHNHHDEAGDDRPRRFTTHGGSRPCRDSHEHGFNCYCPAESAVHELMKSGSSDGEGEEFSGEQEAQQGQQQGQQQRKEQQQEDGGKRMVEVKEESEQEPIDGGGQVPPHQLEDSNGHHHPHSNLHHPHTHTHHYYGSHSSNNGYLHHYHNHFEEFTNNSIVEQAFDECDLNQTGTLSLSEFRLWVERNPTVAQFLQSVFPYDENRDWGDDNKHLPFSHRKDFNHPGPIAGCSGAGAGGMLAGGSAGSGGGGGGGGGGAGGRLSLDSHHSLDHSVVGGGGGGGGEEEVTRLLVRARALTHDVYLREQLTTIIDDRVEAAGVAERAEADAPHGDGGGVGGGGSVAAAAAAAAAAGGGGGGGESNGDQQRHGSNTSHASEEYEDYEADDLHGGCQASRCGVQICGSLFKQGNRVKTWKQRWYVVVNQCIYYYQGEHHRLPRGVMFLTGAFVDDASEPEAEKKNYWALDITREGTTRRLYARSKADRDLWVSELRQASTVVPIEDKYNIGEEVGVGRFSKVHMCVDKKTLERKAVKIIEKESMDEEERELLHAEIAIMKIVRHPNIIRMEAVYESRNSIFIVMELHSGGELFDRIVGKPRFSEDEAFQVVYPLVESVAYLHEMGVVHRDLKPENILCGEDIADIKIADFGLSKMVMPDELMKMPCGTLSYVAPEVLTLKGYGKEADIWSVGVITYLLVRGRLPFDGDSREEIIENTINGNLPGVEEDDVWASFSPDLRDMMVGMLNKDSKKRLTAKQLLEHQWVTERVDRLIDDSLDDGSTHRFQDHHAHRHHDHTHYNGSNGHGSNGNGNGHTHYQRGSCASQSSSVQGGGVGYETNGYGHTHTTTHR